MDEPKHIKLPQKDITETLKEGKLFNCITKRVFEKPSIPGIGAARNNFDINYYPYRDEVDNQNNETERCNCYQSNTYTWKIEGTAFEYSDEEEMLLYCYLPEPNSLGALTARCTARNGQPLFFSSGPLSSCTFCAILLNDMDLLLIHAGNNQYGKVNAFNVAYDYAAASTNDENEQWKLVGAISNEIRFAIIYNAVNRCLHRNVQNQNRLPLSELTNYLLDLDQISGFALMMIGNRLLHETVSTGQKKYVVREYCSGGLTALMNARGTQILAGEYKSEYINFGKCGFHYINGRIDNSVIDEHRDPPKRDGCILF